MALDLEYLKVSIPLWFSLRRAVLRCSSQIMDPSFVRALGAIPRHYASRTPPSCHPVMFLYGISLLLFRRTSSRRGAEPLVLSQNRAYGPRTRLMDRVSDTSTGDDSTMSYRISSSLQRTCWEWRN